MKRTRQGSGRGPRAETRIRLLVLDVDGVLTDGRLWFGPRGEQLKVFHVRDGHGIREALTAGIEIVVLSGRRSRAVERRCAELGIRRLYQGVTDKRSVVERVRKRLGVMAGQCACIGDDTPDVPVMRTVGLAFAVADAHPSAIAAADHVTAHAGGEGAVREVCDRLLAGRKSRT